MSVFRLALTGLIIVLCAWLVIAHGIRGLVIVAVVIDVTSLPQTRVWRVTEDTLVRLTGSKRRASAVVFGLIIAAMAAIGLYQFFAG